MRGKSTIPLHQKWTI